MIIENCPHLPLPYPTFNNNFSGMAKCWVSEGVGGKFLRNVLLIHLLHKTDSLFSQEINMKETKTESTLYRIALRVDVKKYPV